MSGTELFDRGLAELAPELAADVRARLAAYAALLVKWNKVYNLTAIRDPQSVVTHHLLDSLAVLPYVEGIATLADVGSGGGLPGIPLAIARPALSITSIETVNKKATFQQQARIELGLANFTVLNARVEDVRPEQPSPNRPRTDALSAEGEPRSGGGTHLQPFDAVISRAFSELADFVALTAHLLAPGGRFLAMKGVYPHDEIARLPAGFRVVDSHRLAVPGVDAERHLIILEQS